MKRYFVEWVHTADPDFHSGFVLLKVNGSQIQATKRETFQSRSSRTVHMIVDALCRLDNLPRTFEIPVFTGDASWRTPRHNGMKVLAYSTSDMPACSHVLPIPDFIFTGWPEAGVESYDNVTRQCVEIGDAPPEHNNIFWIGSPKTNPIRQEAVERFEHIDGFSINPMTWGSNTAVNNGASQYVSIQDHAKHSILCDLPAGGYSGRLKMLLWTGRPVIIYRTIYSEFFFSGLKHGENCFFVQSLDEFQEAGQKLLDDKELAARIGAGGRLFAQQNLTYTHAIEHLSSTLQQAYFS